MQSRGIPANNFNLSEEEYSTSQSLNRKGTADSLLLRTELAIHQKSEEPSYCKVTDSICFIIISKFLRSDFYELWQQHKQLKPWRLWGWTWYFEWYFWYLVWHFKFLKNTIYFPMQALTTNFCSLIIICWIFLLSFTYFSNTSSSLNINWCHCKFFHRDNLSRISCNLFVR